MYSFFFAVESAPSHPKHRRPKTAWAWAIVALADPQEGSEAAARDSLAAAYWRAGELLEARVIDVEDFESLPCEARMVLQRHPIYAEIYANRPGQSCVSEDVPEWLQVLKETYVRPGNETVIHMRLNDDARMRLTDLATSFGLTLEDWMQRTMEEVAEDLRLNDEEGGKGLRVVEPSDWFDDGPEGLR